MKDIYKSAGVIIENRKLLITRTQGKSFFIAPGGKRGRDETDEDALIRELQE
jgi:8-oxo-dGTP pyrophosphatase MutT (NUDIX family)